MSHFNLSDFLNTLLESLDELFKRLEEPSYCLRCDVPVIQPTAALRQELATAKTAFKEKKHDLAAIATTRISDRLIKLILESGELDLDDLDDQTAKQMADFLVQRLVLPVVFDVLRRKYVETRSDESKRFGWLFAILYFGTLGITILDGRMQEWMSQELSVHRFGALGGEAWQAWKAEIEGENTEDSHWPIYLADIIGFLTPLTIPLSNKLRTHLWMTHGWESADAIPFPAAAEVAEHTVSIWWEDHPDLKAEENNYQLTPPADPSTFERLGLTLIPLLAKHGGPYVLPLPQLGLASTPSVAPNARRNITPSAIQNAALDNPSAAVVKKKTFGNWALELHAPDNLASVIGNVDAKLTYSSDEPLFSLGNEDEPERGVSLTINNFELAANAAYNFDVLEETDLGAVIRIKKATFSLGNPGGSDLLKRALPKGIGGTFKAGLGIKLKPKQDPQFFWEGGLGLDLYVPIDWETPSIAGISIDIPNLKLALKGQQIESGAQLALDFGISIALNLGPLTLSTTGLGGTLSLTHTSGLQGNLGPMNFDWTLLEPDSLGIALKTGPVNGGGFLARDEEKDRWFGALSLKFSKFTLDGVIMTEGDSVLGIVWASRLNLPFLGGQIEGLGILVGCDRTVSIDAFTQGLKNNVLDSILFPSDPVAKAPQILATVSQLLPRAENHTVLGVMARWVFGGQSRLFAVELGILLEFVGKSLRAGFLIGQGSLRLRKVPESVFALNLDLFGAIDRGRGDNDDNEYFLKAVLRNSRVAGSELTGSGLFYKGPKSEFVISVGGFNPRYPVPSHPLFDLDRVKATLVNRDNLKLFFQGYIALTTSSFQIGIHAQLLYKKAGFTVEGLLSLDVLARFEGQFFVDLALELAVRRGSRMIAGIGLEGTFSGTSPWRIEGRARLKLLFLKVSFPIKWQSSGDKPAAAEPVDALAALRAELIAPENWSGNTPSTGIVLREISREGVWIDAKNSLRVQQTAVPLEERITRIGPSPLRQPTTFEITDVQLGQTSQAWQAVEDNFSPGLYQDVDLDEAVRAPMYEKMAAGVELTDTTLDIGDAVDGGHAYEEEFIDDELDQAFRTEVNRRRRDRAAMTLPQNALATLGHTGLRPLAVSHSLQRPDTDFYQVSAEPITVQSPRYLIADDNLQLDDRLDRSTAERGLSYSQARHLLHKGWIQRSRSNIVYRYEAVT
ncbi:MAG: DUF6603 domain-containing protein [Cyanobacteria bacterium P01_A01_bin.123]